MDHNISELRSQCLLFYRPCSLCYLFFAGKEKKIICKSYISFNNEFACWQIFKTESSSSFQLFNYPPETKVHTWGYEWMSVISVFLIFRAFFSFFILFAYYSLLFTFEHLIIFFSIFWGINFLCSLYFLPISFSSVKSIHFIKITASQCTTMQAINNPI